MKGAIGCNEETIKDVSSTEKNPNVQMEDMHTNIQIYVENLILLIVGD